MGGKVGTPRKGEGDGVGLKRSNHKQRKGATNTTSSQKALDTSGNAPSTIQKPNPINDTSAGGDHPAIHASSRIGQHPVRSTPSKLPVPIGTHHHRNPIHGATTVASHQTQSEVAQKKKLLVGGLKRYTESRRLNCPPLWTKEFPCRSRFHVDTYIYDFERDGLHPRRTAIAMSGCPKKGGRCDRCGIYCANICSACRRCAADCQCEHGLMNSTGHDYSSGGDSKPDYGTFAEAEAMLSDFRAHKGSPLPLQYPFNSGQHAADIKGPNYGRYPAPPFVPSPPSLYQTMPLPNMSWPYFPLQNGYHYPPAMPPPIASFLSPPPPYFGQYIANTPQQFGDYANTQVPAPVYRQFVNGVRQR